MIDSVLKGTGNSRFLKSAVPAGTSWADALAMLQAGTFPIDFNGINTEGFQQLGTPLNKANLLKDATADQIGLPPSTTPDGMFQALGNTGELHVWRKTVVSSSEQPAGYTLGDVITNSEIWVENRYEDAVFHYATSISVSDAGLVSLVGEKTATIGHSNNGENIAEFDVFKGKFVYISGGDNNKRQFIFYIPANATFHRDGNYSTNKIYADKEQRVNAHGIIPPGTTTTYPVSTNPNAYQEGKYGKAGYTLGDVKTGTFQIGQGATTIAANRAIIKYGESVSVTDTGTASIASESELTVTSDSSQSAVDKLKGKFFRFSQLPFSSSAFSVGKIYFFPVNTVFTKQSSGNWYASKYQTVTSHGKTEPEYTIEYLGKLGDKARVQVLSYVGTGTYGADNPNSLTFDFVPKVVIISKITADSAPWALFLPPILSGIYSKRAYNITGVTTKQTDSFAKINKKTLSWFSTNGFTPQLNSQSDKYTAIAIG